MTSFIEKETMQLLPTVGGLVSRVTWRKAPQAISMQARLNISGLCITHSWAQDATRDPAACVPVVERTLQAHATGRLVVES